ncbi:MAG: penicillin-insensitive murein endopeptidase [Proteobacteria bacterium]|nr:penicillin-insensitive murein endopeptidase [Pseudomonadota bacterium]
MGNYRGLANSPGAALLTTLIGLGSAACVGQAAPATETVPFGATWHGILRGGEALPDRGPGFVRVRPGGSTRWGTPELVRALQRAAASVARAFPGGAPLRVGDLSGPGGGRHHRHASHRTGLDADVLFYVTDGWGRTVDGPGWPVFDRAGLPHRRAEDSARRGSLRPLFFDSARNWHLVRTLLTDPEVQVQWILCSNGVKAMLLSHAAQHEQDPDVLVRASYVLHQPSSGAPHGDHFHIRLWCSSRERAWGCLPGPPRWPWLNQQAGEMPSPLPATDQALVHALLQGADSRPAETTHASSGF